MKTQFYLYTDCPYQTFFFIVGIAWNPVQQAYLAENFTLERCSVQLEFELDELAVDIFVRPTELNDTILDESVMGNEMNDGDEAKLDFPSPQKQPQVEQSSAADAEEQDPPFYVEFLMYNGQFANFQEKTISMNFEGCEYNWYTSSTNQKVILI